MVTFKGPPQRKNNDYFVFTVIKEGLVQWINNDFKGLYQSKIQ